MQGSKIIERTRPARVESDSGEVRKVRREAKRTLLRNRSEERQRKYAAVL